MNREIAPDPWSELRRHTPARLGLGRAGTSLPTRELLDFGAAHAQARDAVLLPLDVAGLSTELSGVGLECLSVQSQASNREVYLRRPDLGRRLAAENVEGLQALAAEPVDLAIVLGDGLSAIATQRHAAALLVQLKQVLGERLTWAPLVIATQARVALGDEIGALLGARAVLMLLGERPGLSSPDSLGAYLTFGPRVGRNDAERNCVSNIRPEGLAPDLAAKRLAWLLQEALRRRLSGVALKDDSERELLGG
ncbi:ethanolamine ammonia-lyase subunit EutC [Roseateles oligotrophus]|uniref:Ethanolamine ammonia-lyase small subunit n=1 Tax=Roseateles oligotrophus TaxID=1769250 RepID=A0ABT2YK48_9BURK|nr:ethanolamine ammonia-lyase subunit EutC [Roseateles oligotrophus]MCV2370377.1 ethanolamine ammonia-lyase subunit EutC [Roseateles oligotrophus]